ncbi:MAG: S41 family peptidase [Clostridia bacterium]|jgi:carboxyl-terminal processing protease|nr:S41 family peptidase [Clostridia bacterium]
MKKFIKYFITFNLGFILATSIFNSRYNLFKIMELERIIENVYINDYDKEAVRDGIFEGMLHSLDDKYSEYMTKEEYSKFNELVDAEYSGIGVSFIIDRLDKTLLILNVFKDTPSEEAGLIAGDKIFEIDGQEVMTKSFDEIIDLISGEEGSIVKLKIVRDSKEMKFEIKRKSINAETVEWKELESDIVYVKINSFASTTAEEFKNIYDDIDEYKNIIIDVRNNPGGIVTSATEIADFFLDEGKMITYIKNKSDSKFEYKATEKGNTLHNVFMLQNKYSASASEILTAALRDNNVAKIVGEKSYGKGVVQSLLEFKDGSSVKITSGKYYTPDNKNINEIGIEPDYKVELDIDNYDYLLDVSKDKQIQETINIIRGE